MANYTEEQRAARRKAHNKYVAEKVESIRFRVPKGKKTLIQQAAETNGESVNAMLNRLVDKEIKKVLK